MFPPLLRCVPLLALALTSCSEQIEIGSECLQRGACSELPMMPDGNRADASVTEAGVIDGGALDAGLVPLLDARTDGKPVDGSDAAPSPYGEFPGFENESFELTAGTYGEVTTVSGVLGATNISPWLTCQPIGIGNTGLTAVRSLPSIPQVVDDDAGTGVLVEATDGAAMVYVSALGNNFFPLFQRLTKQLEPGTRYTFALDIRAITQMPRLNVEVWGGLNMNGCNEDERLAVSELAAPDAWKTVCFDFTAKNPHLRLFLHVRSTLGGLIGESMVFDNLRPATPEICPLLVAR